ncbi:MAG: terpene cyclase/mutase family protein, partial [Desulfobacteraceae bacterium]
EDGGFLGRDNKSDLYYTVFGLELLMALDFPIPVDSLEKYLNTFGHGRELDLVHLASLTRCHVDLSEVTQTAIDSSLRDGLTERLPELRCKDGSFSTSVSDEHGNAYGCFLALAMYQDLDVPVPDPGAIRKCLDALIMEDGGFANEMTGRISATPSTAAALCSCHMLGLPLPPGSVEWLMNQIHSHGGFCALSKENPLCIPDLLSTATALQALSYSDNIKIQREQHLDFLDSLWNHQGGFSGSWADPTVDCEYTYYGLLALGYLADIP